MGGMTFLIRLSTGSTKIENVTIDEKSEEYTKYLNLSRKKIANNLFNTWDKHIKKKYEIDINYKALAVVKNYFN